MTEYCVIIRPLSPFGYRADVTQGTLAAYSPRSVAAEATRPTAGWARRAGERKLRAMRKSHARYWARAARARRAQGDPR